MALNVHPTTAAVLVKARTRLPPASWSRFPPTARSSPLFPPFIPSPGCSSQTSGTLTAARCPGALGALGFPSTWNPLSCTSFAPAVLSRVTGSLPSQAGPPGRGASRTRREPWRSLPTRALESPLSPLPSHPREEPPLGSLRPLRWDPTLGSAPQPPRVLSKCVVLTWVALRGHLPKPRLRRPHTLAASQLSPGREDSRAGPSSSLPPARKPQRGMEDAPLCQLQAPSETPGSRTCETGLQLRPREQ